MGPCRGTSSLGKLLRTRRLSVFLLTSLFSLGLAAQTAKPSANSAADTLQKHYEAARTYGIGGDQEKATVEYKAFLAEALRRIANARAHGGEMDSSTALFNESLSIAPSDKNIRLDYATTLLQQGKPAESKAQSEIVLKAAPDDPRAHYALGRAHLMLQEYPAAREHLEKAVVATPTFDVGYSLGLAYLNLHDLNHAGLLFDEMVAGLGDSPSIHLYFGRAYMETTNSDQAIQEFKKAIARNPKLPQAHYFLAMTYLQRDSEAGFAAAAPEFQAEIQNNPTDYRSHYSLGLIAFKQRRNEDAIPEFFRASEIEPNNPDPLIYLGETYQNADKLPEAEAAMRKAIALTTDISRNQYQINRAHYVLGRILVQTGRREEGAKELKISQDIRAQLRPTAERTGKIEDVVGAPEKAAAVLSTAETSAPADRPQVQAYIDGLRPAVADAYNTLGVFAAGKKDYTVGLTYFQKAAEWDPSLETVDRNLGMAAFYANQPNLAGPALSRHLQSHPDDTRVRAALALLLFGAEDYPKTLLTLQPIQDEVDKDPGLGYAYAVSLVKTGKYDEGVGRLKALEQANPKSADVHELLGEAFSDQKVYPTAIEEFKKTIALDPARPRAHFLLGLAQIYQGSPAEAVTQLRIALKLTPKDIPTKYHLAFALLQVQQKEEGQKLLHEVIQQDPKYTDAYYQLGKLQLEEGDTKSAIANLEAGVKLSPDSDYIHYQLAMAYRRDSRTDDAQREMQVYQGLKNSRRGSHEALQPN